MLLDTVYNFINNKTNINSSSLLKGLGLMVQWDKEYYESNSVLRKQKNFIERNYWKNH